MRMTTKNSDITFGIQSNTENNKHIFMGDFDTKKNFSQSYILLLQTMMDIQKEFKISDIYIQKTKNGFHFFSLDKLEIEEVSNILLNYDTFDVLYVTLSISKERGFFVHRFGKDKFYLDCVNSPFNLYDKSYAHYCFFRDICHYPIHSYSNFDMNTKVDIIAYRSKKHGWYKWEGTLKTMTDLNNL